MRTLSIGDEIKRAKEFLAVYPGRHQQLAILTEAKMIELRKTDEPGSRKQLRQQARKWAKQALKAMKVTAVMNG